MTALMEMNGVELEMTVSTSKERHGESRRIIILLWRDDANDLVRYSEQMKIISSDKFLSRS